MRSTVTPAGEPIPIGGARKYPDIFQFIDTTTCAAAVRAFRQSANERKNSVVCRVAADLSFLQCGFGGNGDRLRRPATAPRPS